MKEMKILPLHRFIHNPSPSLFIYLFYLTLFILRVGKCAIYSGNYHFSFQQYEHMSFFLWKSKRSFGIEH